MNNKLLIALLTPIIATTAHSADFNPATLEEINAAMVTATSNSESDIINLPSGTIVGSLIVPKNLNNDTITIKGAGEGVTILDGNQLPVIKTNNVQSDTASFIPTLVVEDLTIINGKEVTPNRWGGAGAINAFYSHVKLNNVTLSNNSGDDGVVWGYSIIANNITASGNDGYNAGVLSAEVFSKVTNSEFTNNSSLWSGGAIRVNCIGKADDSEYINEITNSNFTDNTTVQFGGAVYSMECQKTIVKGSQFTHNSATQGLGGAVAVRDRVSLTIADTSFVGNSASGSYVEHCGAAEAERNYCQGDGGAIFFDDYYAGEIIITDSEFLNNSASGTGGAISADGTCSLGYPNPESDSACDPYSGQTKLTKNTISKTAFSNNTAGEFDSGAIFTSEGATNGNGYTYGEVEFTEVTFINNDVYSVSGLLDVDVIRSLELTINSVAAVDMGAENIVLTYDVVGTPTSEVWTQTSGPSNPLNGNTFIVPAVVDTATTYVYELTVSDEHNIDTKSVSITVNHVGAVVEPPETVESSGGSTSVASILALTFLVFMRRFSQR